MIRRSANKARHTHKNVNNKIFKKYILIAERQIGVIRV